MTGYVTTRFWRAPEILLQWMHYGEKGSGVVLSTAFIVTTIFCSQWTFGRSVVYWQNCSVARRYSLGLIVSTCILPKLAINLTRESILYIIIHVHV